MAGIRWIKALVGSFFGLRMSEGSITGAVRECGERLSGPVTAIKGAVLRTGVVHFDETEMRNRGRGAAYGIDEAVHVLDNTPQAWEGVDRQRR